MVKVVMETPRLILREFTEDDASGMFQLNSDPEVIRYTGDPAFKSDEDARLFLRRYDRYQKDGYGRWTVLLKADKDYVGWCGLSYSADTGETDLGFRLKRSYWNQGIATEAAAYCLNLGFQELGLTRIIGRAMKDNKASIRVLEKIGMTFASEFEAHGAKCVKYCTAKKI